MSYDSEKRHKWRSFKFCCCLPISPILPNNAKSQVERQKNIAANAKSNSTIREEQPRKTQPLTSIKKKKGRTNPCIESCWQVLLNINSIDRGDIIKQPYIPWCWMCTGPDICFTRGCWLGVLFCVALSGRKQFSLSCTLTHHQNSHCLFGYLSCPFLSFNWKDNFRENEGSYLF